MLALRSIYIKHTVWHYPSITFYVFSYDTWLCDCDCDLVMWQMCDSDVTLTLTLSSKNRKIDRKLKRKIKIKIKIIKVHHFQLWHSCYYKLLNKKKGVNIEVSAVDIETLEHDEFFSHVLVFTCIFLAAHIIYLTYTSFSIYIMYISSLIQYWASLSLSELEPTDYQVFT